MYVPMSTYDTQHATVLLIYPDLPFPQPSRGNTISTSGSISIADPIVMAAATGIAEAGHEPLLGQRDDLDLPPEPREKIVVNFITGKRKSPRVQVGSSPYHSSF
jgi:hypothetical protein